MNILDPRFRYVNSANTDIRKTFARVRREQEAAKQKTAKAQVRAMQRPPQKVAA